MPGSIPQSKTCLAYGLSNQGNCVNPLLPLAHGVGKDLVPVFYADGSRDVVKPQAFLELLLHSVLM